MAITEIGDSEPESLGAWRQDPGAAPHGGETLAHLLDRVGAWLDEPSPRPRVVAVADAPVPKASLSTDDPTDLSPEAAASRKAAESGSPVEVDAETTPTQQMAGVRRDYECG